jgi:hypothetical protein
MDAYSSAGTSFFPGYGGITCRVDDKPDGAWKQQAGDQADSITSINSCAEILPFDTSPYTRRVQGIFTQIVRNQSSSAPRDSCDEI